MQHCALGAARAVPAQGTVDARVLNLGRGICVSGALLFARVRRGGCGWGTWPPLSLPKVAQLQGVGCYWESRPSCRARSLKYLPEQMRVDESTLTSAATAAGTDSAQGGTVDCAATTELTCSGTDSAQRGTAVTRAEAGPKSLAPRNKRKRKKARSSGCMSKNARRREAFEQKLTK